MITKEQLEQMTQEEKQKLCDEMTLYIKTVRSLAAKEFDTTEEDASGTLIIALVRFLLVNEKIDTLLQVSSVIVKDILEHFKMKI